MQKIFLGVMILKRIYYEETYGPINYNNLKFNWVNNTVCALPMANFVTL